MYFLQNFSELAFQILRFRVVTLDHLPDPRAPMSTCIHRAPSTNSLPITAPAPAPIQHFPAFLPAALLPILLS